MSIASLIPQSFWFRLSIPAARIDGLPKDKEKRRLLDLPESCRVITSADLEGRASWSECRVAWNLEGLALQFEVRDKVSPIYFDPNLPEVTDGVQIWIDTRDTRDIHRASRFCHRFTAVLIPDKGKKTVSVQFSQNPIHRAIANSAIANPTAIHARAEATKNGWRLEIFLGAEALTGFEPETNRRLGFAYQVGDSDRGNEFLTVGREFPIGEDPSLWATLELQG